MDFSAVLDFCTQIKNKTAAKPFPLFWVFVIYYCKQVADRKSIEKKFFHRGFESHHHLEKYKFMEEEENE